MKSTYLKEHGKVMEMIELEEEQKWFNIKYIRWNFRKTAYVIKHNQETTNNYIENFLKDCHASEEIINDLKNPLKKGNKGIETSLQEFVNFLVKTSSIHIMGGIALGLSIFGGYQLGAKMDEHLHNYPSYTVIGLLCGLVVGCLIGYIMMYKYLGILSKKGKPKTKTQDHRKNIEEAVKWPTLESTLYDVRYAVKQFSDDLPKGINRTILVKEDNSINFDQLAPYLHGIPSKPFYMSKETFDIFEEKDKNIPPIIDKVQKAVNLFYKKNNTYPAMPYDSFHRVNYFQLLQDHYLDEMPSIELYITEYHGLLTHLRPQKKRVGG